MRALASAAVTVSYRPLCRVVCVFCFFFLLTRHSSFLLIHFEQLGPKNQENHKKTAGNVPYRRHRRRERADQASLCLNILLSTFVLFFKKTQKQKSRRFRWGMWTDCVVARWTSSMCEQWVRCLEVEVYFEELLLLKMSHWCGMAWKKRAVLAI